MIVLSEKTMNLFVSLKELELADFFLIFLQNFHLYKKLNYVNVDIHITDEKLENFLDKVLMLSTSWIEEKTNYRINIFSMLSFQNNQITLVVSDAGNEIVHEILNLMKSYEFQDISSLKNQYARRLYVFLLLNKPQHINLNIDELKEIFHPPTDIIKWTQFKAKILEPSVQAINTCQNINLSYELIKDGRTISGIEFNSIYLASEDIFKKINSSSVIEYISKDFVELQKVSQLTEVVSEQTLIEKEKVDGAKKVVEYFDKRRQELQPNFRRIEYKNIDAIYQLRLHFKETGRTPEMFIDAINWLFSDRKEAEFHRAYIMSIGKLIEKFNTLEHLAIYSKESIKMSEEAKSWANVYKKQGLGDEEIIQKLKEGGYL
ncbi:replication initiation protein [bacterium]|nr:replication initiation protein [bacterium]MBU1882740.1 replication initiation protein [bacterium]